MVRFGRLGRARPHGISELDMAGQDQDLLAAQLEELGGVRSIATLSAATSRGPGSATSDEDEDGPIRDRAGRLLRHGHELDPLAAIERLAREEEEGLDGYVQDEPEFAPTVAAAQAAAAWETPRPSRSSLELGPEKGRASPAPDAEAEAGTGTGAGTSWWDGLLTSAASVARTAGAAVEELQQSDEAQWWAHNMREIGNAITTHAIPTISTIMETLAPPISKHEVIQIRVLEKLKGYPSLDRLVQGPFERVLSQVDGAELVVRRMEGSTVRAKRAAARAPARRRDWLGDDWWADGRTGRKMEVMAGIGEASDAAVRVATATASEHLDRRRRRSGPAAAADDGGPTDVFLAVQAATTAGQDLAAAAAGGETGEASPAVAFAVCLHDRVHGVTVRTVSQSFPQQWVDWIEFGGGPGQPAVHPDIGRAVAGGGKDPRAWAVEWISDSIRMAVGILAQQYVAKRMNVGRARQQPRMAAAGAAE